MLGIVSDIGDKEVKGSWTSAGIYQVQWRTCSRTFFSKQTEPFHLLMLLSFIFCQYHFSAFLGSHGFFWIWILTERNFLGNVCKFGFSYSIPGNKIPGLLNLLREKVYFGSEFEKVQFSNTPVPIIWVCGKSASTSWQSEVMEQTCLHHDPYSKERRRGCKTSGTERPTTKAYLSKLPSLPNCIILGTYGGHLASKL